MVSRCLRDVMAPDLLVGDRRSVLGLAGRLCGGNSKVS